MKRTVDSNMMVKEESKGITVYYPAKYIFSKLKRRIENEEAKIKIEEPIAIELQVISLGVVE
jgi:hypothetical protein